MNTIKIKCPNMNTIKIKCPNDCCVGKYSENKPLPTCPYIGCGEKMIEISEEQYNEIKSYDC